MDLIVSKEQCTGCTACVNICPKQCISMKIDDEGFYYPHIDSAKCIDCKACVHVCPTINRAQNDTKLPKAFAVQISNDNIRRESASGGAFSLIAEDILKKGGVVYGCVYTASFQVEHDKIENLSDLYKCRGSKYVQSNLRNIFSDIKKDLKSNRYVLFSGTPCQVAGLKSFLKSLALSSNLLTIDFVCHGIPSPGLWNDFLLYLEKKYGKISYVSFRDKHFGYAGSSMAFGFEKRKVMYTERDIQFYKKLFFDGINMRPSCFDCKFKSINRVSDLTLFDCWHINRVSKEMDDDKGTTWVLTHSNKGLECLERNKSYCKIVEYSIQGAIRMDGDMAVSCPTKSPKRAEFFTDLRTKDMDFLINKYSPQTIKKVIVNLLKPILYKLNILNSVKRLR